MKEKYVVWAYALIGVIIAVICPPLGQMTVWAAPLISLISGAFLALCENQMFEHPFKTVAFHAGCCVAGAVVAAALISVF